MHYSSCCGQGLVRASKGALGALLLTYGVLIPVHFTVHIPQAEKVMLVGRFQGGWDSPRPLAVDGNGYWYVQLRLPPGSYEYFYLVDGEPWVDVSAPRVEDGLGGQNNVVSLALEGW